MISESAISDISNQQYWIDICKYIIYKVPQNLIWYLWHNGVSWYLKACFKWCSWLSAIDALKQAAIHKEWFYRVIYGHTLC